MRLRYKIILVLMFCAAILVACGDNENFKDLRTYIDNLHTHKTRSNNKAAPISSNVKIPDTITYKASTLRVPFVENQPAIGEPVQTTNPLQAYPLNMLRFVGTISRENIMYAYIAAPDGIIYEIKEGDLLGDHYGKVASIGPDQMKVREQVTEAGKRPTERLITLQLKETH